MFLSHILTRPARFFAPEGKGSNGGRSLTPAGLTVDRRTITLTALENNSPVPGMPELIVQSGLDHSGQFAPSKVRVLANGQVQIPTDIHLPETRGRSRTNIHLVSQELILNGDRFLLQLVQTHTVEDTRLEPSQVFRVDQKTFMSRGNEQYFAYEESSSARLELVKLNVRAGNRTIFRSPDIRSFDSRFFRLEVAGQEIFVGCERTIDRIREDQSKAAERSEISVEVLEVTDFMNILQGGDFTVLLAAKGGRVRTVASTAEKADQPFPPTRLEIDGSRYEIDLQCKRALKPGYGLSLPTYHCVISRLEPNGERKQLWAETQTVGSQLKVTLRGKTFFLIPTARS